jgi:NADPH:quinone reductase-like Zn-dependent oxidoreductase
MTLMKVARKMPGDLDALVVGAAETPNQPGPGEIVVRLHASSLNFHDYAVCKGMAPVEEGRIPLSDGAGEVLAVGAGVAEFAVGDNIISTFFRDWLDGAPIVHGFDQVPGEGVDGYACEQVCAPATAFTHAPKGYSHAEAATLPCAALTAWRALVVEGGLKAGQTVLVQGTGGVSLFALQFAKAMGARVIATTSSAAKQERLIALGADHVINYREQPNWGAIANELAGNGGVDHVVEVGGANTLNESIMASRPGAQITIIGILAGYMAQLPVPLIMRKQLRLVGVTVGTRRSQQDMVRAIEASGIRPVIDSHFPLDRLADAFRHQESGAHFGKIVIDI